MGLSFLFRNGDIYAPSARARRRIEAVGVSEGKPIVGSDASYATARPT